LLRQTAQAGGRQLRLTSGRKAVIVTSAGEQETGQDLPAAAIQQLVGPLMPPAVRQAIAKGPAEWTMNHPELGPIRATARIEGQTLHATFELQNGAAAPAPQPAAAPVSVAAVSDGSAAALDALFRQPFETNASDLHMCAGSPPMVRS